MSRRTALWVLGALMVALLIVLVLLDGRMRDAGGPGIIGFEFAGSEHRVAEILADWGDDGQDAARLSLWIDYPYLLVYGAFLTLAVAATRDLAARLDLRRLAAIGGIVVFFPAAGAGFDALEDVGLLIALDGNGGNAAPLLATICAVAKFVLIDVAILYVIVGLVQRARHRATAGA
jgi:hypothetical protein